MKDLKLTQGDYNLGNTLSKLGFLTAELPSQMVGKKLGEEGFLFLLPSSLFLPISIFSLPSGLFPLILAGLLY